MREKWECKGRRNHNRISRVRKKSFFNRRGKCNVLFIHSPKSVYSIPNPLSAYWKDVTVYTIIACGFAEGKLHNAVFFFFNADPLRHFSVVTMIQKINE